MGSTKKNAKAAKLLKKTAGGTTNKTTARKSTRRAATKPVAFSTKRTPGHPYSEPKIKRVRTAKGLAHTSSTIPTSRRPRSSSLAATGPDRGRAR